MSQKQMKEGDTDFIRTYAMTLKASETVFNFASNVQITAHVSREISLNNYKNYTLKVNAIVSELKIWLKEISEEINKLTTFCFAHIDFAFDIRKLVSFKTFVKAITRYHDMLMNQDVYFQVYSHPKEYTKYIYQRNMSDKKRIPYDILKNMYEEFFGELRGFERIGMDAELPKWEYEEWYDERVDYRKLGYVGASLTYLRLHPKMFNGYTVDMKFAGFSVNLIRRDDNAIYDYMIFLEVKPEHEENDNTTDIMQLVEEKIASQMLNKYAVAQLTKDVIKPKRIAFIILSDEETIKNENSTAFRHRYRSEDIEIDIEFWVLRGEHYIRVMDDGTITSANSVTHECNLKSIEQGYNEYLKKHVPMSKLHQRWNKINEDFLDDISTSDLNTVPDVQPSSERYRIDLFNEQQAVSIGNIHDPKYGDYPYPTVIRDFVGDLIVKKYKAVYLRLRDVVARTMFIEEPKFTFRTYFGEDDLMNEYTPHEWFNGKCIDYFTTLGMYGTCHVSFSVEYNAAPVSLKQFIKDMYRIWRDVGHQTVTMLNIDNMMVWDVSKSGPENKGLRLFNYLIRDKHFWNEELLQIYDGMYGTSYLLDAEKVSEMNSDEYKESHKRPLWISTEHARYINYLFHHTDEIIPGNKSWLCGYLSDTSISKIDCRGKFIFLMTEPKDSKYSYDRLQRQIKELYSRICEKSKQFDGRLHRTNNYNFVVINAQKWVEDGEMNKNPMVLFKDGYCKLIVCNQYNDVIPAGRRKNPVRIDDWVKQASFRLRDFIAGKDGSL